MQTQVLESVRTGAAVRSRRQTSTRTEAALGLFASAGIVAVKQEDGRLRISDRFNYWPATDYWKATDGSRQGYTARRLIDTVKQTGLA